MSHGHSEKEYSLFQVASNLFGACLIAGAIIAGLYYYTAPIAQEKAELLKQASMQALVPTAEEFDPIQGQKEWFEAKKGNQTIAYVVPGESKGFGGEIKMLVAVDTQGKVINYDILKHNETPGLGDGANLPPFKQQFPGRSANLLEVTKDPTDKEKIQAMTGATISSRAVTKGIKEADEKVIAFVGGKK